MYITSDVDKNKLDNISTYIKEVNKNLKSSYEFLEKIKK
jgi:hypothetical protein